MAARFNQRSEQIGVGQLESLSCEVKDIGLKSCESLLLHSRWCPMPDVSMTTRLHSERPYAVMLSVFVMKSIWNSYNLNNCILLCNFAFIISLITAIKYPWGIRCCVCFRHQSPPTGKRTAAILVYLVERLSRCPSAVSYSGCSWR